MWFSLVPRVFLFLQSAMEGGLFGLLSPGANGLMGKSFYLDNISRSQTAMLLETICRLGGVSQLTNTWACGSRFSATAPWNLWKCICVRKTETISTVHRHGSFDILGFICWIDISFLNVHLYLTLVNGPQHNWEVATHSTLSYLLSERLSSLRILIMCACVVTASYLGPCLKLYHIGSFNPR